MAQSFALRGHIKIKLNNTNHQLSGSFLLAKFVSFILLTVTATSIILILAPLSHQQQHQPQHDIGRDETTIHRQLGQRPHPWPSIKIVGPVDNIVADERDGSFFVVLNGDIFKFNNELKLLAGTASDNQILFNTTSRDDNIDTNLLANNKALLILKKPNSNADLLFACATNKDLDLKCWINKITDIRAASPLLWPPDSKTFKIDAKANIQAIVSQQDSNELILTADRTKPVDHNEDINLTKQNLPPIGRFKITKNPKFLSLNQKSVLPYRFRLNDYYLLYDYLYVFNHNNHTYFILNDIRKPVEASRTKEDQYAVRLARVCQNDTELTSYTEISLACNNQDNIEAKHAYFDSTKKDNFLHIVYETVALDYGPKKSSPKSLICSYSMMLIVDVFLKATSDCNNGNQASNLLTKLHLDIEQAPLCQRNPSNFQDWCTSKTNPYIDGNSYIVREDLYLKLDGISGISFFYITRQGVESREVLFLGTRSGHLIKMSYEEDLYYSIDFNKISIKNYATGEKYTQKSTIFPLTNETTIQKSTRFAISSNNLIAISNKGIINQLNTVACYYYNTCKSCLTTRDPLECIWCGDTCTRKQECEHVKQSTLSCSPIIRDFYPKSGPISGDTKLKIYGENFGTDKGNTKVILGDLDCIINRDSQTDEVIECITKSVKFSHNATIAIHVADDSTYIYSNGSTSSTIPFKYTQIKIYGLTPSRGPKSGHFYVNIYGENLDAGYNRSVYLDDIECGVTNYQSDKLVCMIKPFNNSSNNQSLSELKTLRVFIDGIEQTIIEPRPSFQHLNLSTNFMFTSEPIATDSSITSVDGVHDEDDSSFYLILSIIVSLVLLVLLFIFLFGKKKIPQIRIKLPFSFELKYTKEDHTKVTFRNPQSQRFANQDTNTCADSINGGLVKLNGSVMSSGYFGRPEQLDQDQPLMTNGSNIIDNEMMLILAQEKILIDRLKLTLGHVLGSGQFGRVYKGFLKKDNGEHIAVAVKTLHSRCAWQDTQDNRAFLDEGLMMKDFDHDNVLALIGVTFDSNGMPMVITPFMLYGDLRSYISDEASSPTVRELIDFGTQVARGMAYLSNLKFVHRDLAARNCMLDEDLKVKIADFGLSRDIYERDYYSSDNKKTKLPIKWMAIESLEKCIYNNKTDVWSYGVLLWELMTRGVVPYPDVDNFDLFSYLKEGRRMLRPRYCPIILYKIMLSCWDDDPFKRPSFDDLVVSVSSVINQLEVAKDGQQKVSRDTTYCDVIK